MKKRSRELNIFSMSALDLFASAMGAFILITFVLLPYFPNTGDSAERVAEVRKQLEQAQSDLQATRAQLGACKSQNQQTQAALDSCEEQRQSSVSRDALGACEERVEALQQQIDDTSVLLGIKTKAKKFVFVVDMSGSIYQPGKQDYRQFIRLSIQEILTAFKSEIELVMIGFHAPNRNTKLHYWPTNRTYFQVNQNTQNRVISSINNWMRQVAGSTPTREALLAALALSPEEIILLSDGAPAGDWRIVANAITNRNTRRIPIHAIAVGNYVEERDFIDFLVQLTKRNNGSLVGAKPG